MLQIKRLFTFSSNVGGRRRPEHAVAGGRQRAAPVLLDQRPRLVQPVDGVLDGRRCHSPQEARNGAHHIFSGRDPVSRSDGVGDLDHRQHRQPVGVVKQLVLLDAQIDLESTHSKPRKHVHV